MRPSHIKTTNYTEMDKEELKQIVKEELERIQSLGLFPNTSVYTEHKSLDAPTYQTILKALAPIRWKALLAELGIYAKSDATVPVYSRGWNYYSTEDLLDKMFARMKELPYISFLTYDQNRGSDAPPITTVLKRLDCKWNDLVQMYIERYGYTDNLTKERNVAVPLTRYNELIAAEQELRKLKGVE